MPTMNPFRQFFIWNNIFSYDNCYRHITGIHWCGKVNKYFLLYDRFFSYRLFCLSNSVPPLWHLYFHLKMVYFHMKYFNPNETLYFWEVCGGEEKVVFLSWWCSVFFPSFCFFLVYGFVLKGGSITLITINSSIFTYGRIIFGTIWVNGTIWDQV